MFVKKALIVGIDDYSQCPLYGCCNDAKAVANILRADDKGNPNFSVKLEENIETKAKLKNLIKDCFSGDGDIALFYYSGHGHIDELGGYLVTPDYSMDDPGVSLQDVLSMANMSKFKNRIIILDSCFSGFMGNISTEGQNTAVINEGVTILTASRSSETSIEVNGHGVFTALLLEALNGGAADITGHITPGGIYAFIDKALGPWDQRPVFKTNVTRFVSVRKITPQVDLSIIRKIGEYFTSPDDKLRLDPSYEFTNTTQRKHEVVEPYANPDNVAVFSDLQKLEGIGIVVPVDEAHMYFAAMNSKSCELTAIGKQYWRLVKENMI
ncbi:MAG: caspase family protein [Bacillota bacterium]|nr:caspase family protein [Bacillota bacterium]